jgi:hypothetical protein
MSDIVGLLDRYRIALLDDPDYLIILALLLRNRSASSEELREETGKSKAQVAALIRDLYRAGWVRTAARDRFFLNAGSEYILEACGILNIALESLIRELVKSDRERSTFGDWITSNPAHLNRRWLHSLQATNCTARAFPEVEEAVWLRVVQLVSSETGSILRREARQIEAERGTESDSSNLRNFWHDCKLPAEPQAREVTLQSVLVLLVFWMLYETDFTNFRVGVGEEPRFLPVFWSEHKLDHNDFGQRFTQVLSRYLPDFDPPSGKFEVTDLLAEVRRRVASIADSQHAGTSEDPRDPIWRLLLHTTKEDR